MDWMAIQDEVFIRRVRVHAHNRRFQNAISQGQKTAQQLAHRLGFGVAYFSPDKVGLGVFSLVVEGDLHSVTQIRQTVEKFTGRILPDVNRTFGWLKLFRLGTWFKPK